MESVPGEQGQWDGMSPIPLPSGISSHDTFGKALATLAPDVFERRIQLWIHALLATHTEGKHIAVVCQSGCGSEMCERTNRSILQGYVSVGEQGR
jgi:hypothetical protein